MKAPGLCLWAWAGVLRQVSLVARYPTGVRPHSGSPPQAVGAAEVGRRSMLSPSAAGRPRSSRKQIVPTCACCPLVVLTGAHRRLMETLVEAGSGRCHGLGWVVRAEDGGERGDVRTSAWQGASAGEELLQPAALPASSVVAGGLDSPGTGRMAGG
ncbi:uncharacterized protein LOC114688148 isoform X2 [Peromyscus leucopus]|uniref:uncharacterized protein LOC114688148 isoform X2 n=1 Tax=Peromyscus leucopus TaxID=10041 RepID=UPI00188575AD|nr:uncharacterized protein LOC114688148 isoform X2 [Peromyscus leucopus]XP_037058540.1 uncharacterized protein LOC114688148 isoform X2 [Peromyscus leucopus]